MTVKISYVWYGNKNTESIVSFKLIKFFVPKNIVNFASSVSKNKNEIFNLLKEIVLFFVFNDQFMFILMPRLLHFYVQNKLCYVHLLC
jgi:hypothetical protein